MDVLSIGIFKAERILYYIEPTEEEILSFYDGMIPESLMAYDGAYGTYDCPGLFRIKTKSGYMEVLGIEFRMNDRQVEYPKNLKSLILSQGLMRSDTIHQDGCSFKG